MNVIIEKSQARGCVNAPISKSDSHRLLIAAALSTETSVIRGLSDCDDVYATVRCLRALGAKIETDGDRTVVTGVCPCDFPENAMLDCNESASTLRFLIPICLLSEKAITFRGKPSLFSRPLGIYAEIAERQGLTFDLSADALTVKGPLRADRFSFPGDVSSQFLSGLLFALPLLKGRSRIKVTGHTVSRPYVGMTLHTLERSGIRVLFSDDGSFYVRGGQAYLPFEGDTEGDHSSAAYLSALSPTDDAVEVTGTNEDSLQGDRIYRDLFRMIREGTPRIDLSDTPDLGPVLFVLAALNHGGVFTGCNRLRLKESDRIAAMAEEMRKCGIFVTTLDDLVTVRPGDLKAPEVPLDGHGDHRVVMALTVLLTAVGGEIADAECVSKSFPEFFGAAKALGVSITIAEESV